MFPVPLLNQAWIASSRSIPTNAKVFVVVHLLQQLPGCKGDNERSKHREFKWPSTISLLLEDPVNAIKIKTNHIKLRSFDKKRLVKGNSFSPLRQVCSSKKHRRKLAKLCNEQGASFTQLCVTFSPHAVQHKIRCDHGK